MHKDARVKCALDNKRRTRMRILVTGFEPNDDGTNASKIVVESLRDEPPESLGNIVDRIAYEIMPPSSARLKAATLRAIEHHQAVFCVFTGQAPGRNKITIERFATNLKDFGSTDGEGKQPRGELIEQDAPAAYWSNLPSQALLVEHLNTREIPAGFSNHAGNHLCNQILFHGLHVGATTKNKVKCGFVHIPALPSQALKQWPGTPFIPLSMAREALALILVELAAMLPNTLK